MGLIKKFRVGESVRYTGDGGKQFDYFKGQDLIIESEGVMNKVQGEVFYPFFKEDGQTRYFISSKYLTKSSQTRTVAVARKSNDNDCGLIKYTAARNKEVWDNIKQRWRSENLPFGSSKTMPTEKQKSRKKAIQSQEFKAMYGSGIELI